MRNKKSKLMAFSLLALCFACLGFGVYALKNATLTVSGTVGFTAHDCMVNVLAYIEGDGVVNGTPDNHGEPSAKRELIINKDENSNEMLVGGASESEWEKVAPVGAIYFTDLTETGEVAQIKMTFDLTNRSAYSVTASISNEEFELTNVRVGASSEITIEAGASGTLTATFDLDANDNGEYPEVNNLPFEVKLDFKKASGGNAGGEEQEELLAPENPTITDETLTFGVVEGATAYEIGYFDADGNLVSSYTVTTTENVLEQKPTTAGTYMVKVRAVKTDGDTTIYSEFKDASEIVVEEQPVLEACQHLTYEECDQWGSTGTGYYKVTGLDSTCTDETIVIPETYNEKSVIEIKSSAFKGITSFSKVVVQGGVTSVWDSAFEGCTNLNEIVISEGVITVGSKAFKDCTNLSKVTIPSSLTDIESYTFSGCTNLSEIVIPEGVQGIKYRAFKDCTNLSKIIIPSTVTGIVSDAFPNVAPIVTVSIADENEAYYVEGSCIIKKENKNLIQGFSNSIIPEDVTCIKASAFSNCNYLSSVVIPKSVTNIETYAFEKCKNLSKVVISEGVKSIANSSFYSCSNLTEIILPNTLLEIQKYAFGSINSSAKFYYQGTSEQYSAITNNDTSNMDGKVYYYSETQPEGEGQYWHYDADGVTPIVW